MHIHKNILYIEDEPEIRRVYERALIKAGYKVHTAQHAQEAIDILDVFQTMHCVVVDLFLPEHNGLAILHHLQSYADWQNIPVIILSSQTRAQIKTSDDYLKDLGVVEYCDKTKTSPKDLVNILERITGGNTT